MAGQVVEITDGVTGQSYGTGNPFPTQVMGSKYQDIGQVLTAGVIAAGAAVFTPAYTGLQWVRNIIAFAQIDVAGWSVMINRGDSSGTTDWNSTLGSSGSSTGTSQWGSVVTTGTAGIVGSQAKFGLKNTTAGASTVGNLRIQLLGQ